MLGLTGTRPGTAAGDGPGTALKRRPNAVANPAMSARRPNGFTLVELVVALAVAGILLGVGVPSFREAVANGRLNATWSELRLALYLARSEAVKRGHPVTVCARATDAACGTDWSNGWIVFVEEERPPSGESPATIERAEDVLRVHASDPGRATVRGVGSSDRTAAGAAERASITFLAEGRATWRNGFLSVCDGRGPRRARALNVALTGDLRAGRRGEGESIERDVFNRPLDCPGPAS